MKILDVAGIRALDAYTIAHEPVTSVDLMERAALAFVAWFVTRFPVPAPVKIFCGPGNNGGDGLAIARLLLAKNYPVAAYAVEFSDKKSPDNQENYLRLSKLLPVKHVRSVNDFPLVGPDDTLVDALVGAGLSRPLDGLAADVVTLLNAQPNPTVAVDIASGLYADAPTPPGTAVVRPRHTVAFQVPKLAFVLPHSAPFVGDWHCVDIGLHAGFLEKMTTTYHYLDAPLAASLVRPRDKFAHKGTFGHALLVVGSYGKMGAATLATRACLRSGAGLVTACVPQCGYDIIQTAAPEAMALTDAHYEHFSALPPLAGYAAVGAGPGLGKAEATRQALHDLLLAVAAADPPPALVLDADALNLLAENRPLLKLLPPNTVLTPHPKEFERLAGPATDDFDRLALLREFAQTYQAVVVLKGANSAIAAPDGTVHFNATGNPGMATGGSGDVLTGLVTGLLAQGYEPLAAALLAVYQHGAAGDRAAAQRGQSALIASDIVEAIGW